MSELRTARPPTKRRPMMAGATRRAKSSLRNIVVEALREEVLSNRLRQGSVIVEKDLAERFRVSKTPVREALSVLVQEGLVEVLPRKGYLVTVTTVQDVRDYFELRAILESAAAELAASRLTEEQFQHMEELVRSYQTAEGSGQMLEANFAFHSLIARVSGNQRIARLIENLLLEMRRLISLGWVPGQHNQLIAALRERNPAKAREAMWEHIATVKDAALSGTTSAAAAPFE